MGYYGPITVRIDCRALLLGTAALAGCGQLNDVGSVVAQAGPVIDSLKKAADDVSLIGDGLAPIVAVIKDKLDPAIVQRVIAEVSAVAQSASDLLKTPSIVGGQPIVQRVVAAVTTVAEIAAPLLAGTPYGAALVAAMALLPALQTAVGFVTSHLGRAAMPPDQARAVLHRFARR